MLTHRSARFSPLAVALAVGALASGCLETPSSESASTELEELAALAVDGETETDTPPGDPDPEPTVEATPPLTEDVSALDDPGSYDWGRSVFAIMVDQDGTPFLLGRKPKITKDTRRHTREVHRQVAEALGAKRYAGDKERRLASYLMVRASIETSEQGNHRPFDGRGAVHSLDVKAAARSGSRLRDRYLEAGNAMAAEAPELWLGYGQGGMISWLWVDNWDLKHGDPRMLGDSVIGALTYARGMRTKLAGLTQGRIACYAWNDEGRILRTPWNGSTYRVGAHKVDEEEYATCMSKPRRRGDSGARESEDKQARRCRLSSRVTYNWKPGDAQPENTVPVPYVDWWQLKRATGGRPCPPWEKDEYEKKKRAKFVSRARRYHLRYQARVRPRDLGKEPEGSQYALWRAIWDAVLAELGEEPFDWQAATEGTIGTVAFEGPTPEKLAQERARERDPRVLDRQWRQRGAPSP